MRGFLRVMRAEIMKVRWPLMLLTVSVAPLLASLMGGGPGPDEEFTAFYMNAVLVYGWIFYPIVAGILAALVCRTEHLDGGWKQMLSLPVRRRDVYVAKYILVAALLGLSQLLLLGGLTVMSLLSDTSVDIPWGTVGLSLLSGWVAVLPLAALQMWVSTRWRSFGGPLALNVALTIPALFAIQSKDFAPWYPWGQPVLGMLTPLAEKGSDNSMLAFSTQTLLIVIVGGFVIWFSAGLVSFVRGDVLS